jgi:prepilin peptidase CpaA
MNVPIPLLCPLGIGLASAVVCDLRRRRIPNAIPGLVFLFGVGVQAYRSGAMAVGSGVAAAFILLFALFPAWRAGGIGGGDVKLAAATGVWVGLSKLIWFALAGAVAGGVVAAVSYALAPAAVRADVRANLVLAGLHGELPSPEVASHRKSKVSIPYALAISAGAAVAILVS